MEKNHEFPKHKKKKKSNTSHAKLKSSHKHEYIDCLFNYIYNDKQKYTSGSYCSVCGKIKHNKFFETEKVDGKPYCRFLNNEEIKEKYKDLPVVVIEDYFYQTHVTEK